MISPSVPPLTARMVAARRSATVFIVRPAEVASHRAVSSANPAGSRVAAINATRFCGARGVSTQSRLGRIASAQTSISAQTRRLLANDTPPRGSSGRSRACIGRHQSALPLSSAPLASHRCCHVPPGWPANQSSSRTSPVRRRGPPAVSAPGTGRRAAEPTTPRGPVRSPARTAPLVGAGTAATAAACRGRSEHPTRPRSARWGPPTRSRPSRAADRTTRPASRGRYTLAAAAGADCRGTIDPADGSPTAPGRPRRWCASTPAITSPGIGVRYSWVVDRWACPRTHCTSVNGNSGSRAIR